ncbi:MAG: GTPase Obg [Chlamydiae bacterium]|nr:GTPase Obg [Chlamydiota bacterium]
MSQEDPIKEYQVLRTEIEQYNPKILEKPSFVLLNKCDAGDFKEKIDAFRSVNFEHKILEISAKNGDGTEKLKEVLFELEELANSYS